MTGDVMYLKQVMGLLDEADPTSAITGTPTAPKGVHVSGVQTFQKCKRRWYYSDADWGLGYRSPRMNDKVTLGIWWHYAQALVAGGDNYVDTVVRVLDRQDELYGPDSITLDLDEKFSSLMSAHELWQQADKSRYSDDQLEYLAIEEKFSLPIYGHRLEGQWDAVVRHKQSDTLYVLERKTTISPNRIEAGINWDLQPRFYTWAAGQLFDGPVVGVIYEIVRNTDPYTVKMLIRNGLPSKAKVELDGTTHEVYYNLLIEAAQERDLDPDQVVADYEQQLNYLLLNKNPIFRRTLFVPSADMRQQSMECMIDASVEMQEADLVAPDMFPALNRHACGLCPYKEVCLAHDDGADWQGLLEIGFVKNLERFDAKCD